MRHENCLRSAPLRLEGDVMAHFASRRKIDVKFAMRAASVDPKKKMHATDYNNLHLCAQLNHFASRNGSRNVKNAHCDITNCVVTNKTRKEAEDRSQN